MLDGYHARETKEAALAVPGDVLFADLRFTEQFVVWSIRKWVEVMRTNDGEMSILQNAFVQAEIGDAFEIFDYIMRGVTVSAKRMIEVRCVRCRAVSLDETIFLGMIEAGQQGDAINASMYLESWLPAAAARIAHLPLIHLAEAMDQAGMRLSGNRERHLALRFDHALH